ncbi:MAG: hypothetical protein K2M95_02290 [Clostridiales bacterium]|nr:hypothetical protein [Clostridiales bacterium]
MDMQSILPLLLQRNTESDARMQMLLKLAEGKKPDIGTMLNLAKPERPAPLGLSPLTALATYGIIGKLASYFSRF